MGLMVLLQIEFKDDNDVEQIETFNNSFSCDSVKFDNFGNLALYNKELDIWLYMSMYDIRPRDLFILQERIIYYRDIIKEVNIKKGIDDEDKI